MRPLLLFLLMDTVHPQVYIPRDSARERKSLLGPFQVANQAACELACNCARGNASAVDCTQFDKVIQPMNCLIYYYTASYCSFLGNYTVNTCMLPIVEHHLEQKSTTTIRTTPTTSTTAKPITTTTAAPTTTTTTAKPTTRTTTTPTTTTPAPTTTTPAPTTTTAAPTTTTTTAKPTTSTTTTPTTTTTVILTKCVDPFAGCPAPASGWTEWTTTAPCSATCGSFGVASRKRTCVSGDCEGPSEDIGPCCIALCPFPSSATCGGSTIKQQSERCRTFFCGLVP